MENNELKKVCIKNRTCYYFVEIIKLELSDIDILINEKSHENILIDISYKTLIGPETLRIRFDKIDGFIKVSDGTKYLVLLGYLVLGPAIYNKIRYLISLKSSIR